MVHQWEWVHCSVMCCHGRRHQGRPHPPGFLLQGRPHQPGVLLHAMQLLVVLLSYRRSQGRKPPYSDLISISIIYFVILYTNRRKKNRNTYETTVNIIRTPTRAHIYTHTHTHIYIQLFIIQYNIRREHANYKYMYICCVWLETQQTIVYIIYNRRLFI